MSNEEVGKIKLQKNAQFAYITKFSAAYCGTLIREGKLKRGMTVTEVKSWMQTRTRTSKKSAHDGKQWYAYTHASASAVIKACADADIVIELVDPRELQKTRDDKNALDARATFESA